MTIPPRHLMIFLCLALLLVGCGGTEYSYRDGRDQKEGPGLLSGKDGVFKVYSAGDGTGEEESQPEKQQTDGKDRQ